MGKGTKKKRQTNNEFVIRVPTEEELEKTRNTPREDPPSFIHSYQDDRYNFNLTDEQFEIALEHEIALNFYALGMADRQSNAGKAPRRSIAVKHQKWQQEAEAIWKRRPNKSKIDVARQIAVKGDNVSTIRQIIHKPITKP